MTFNRGFSLVEVLISIFIVVMSGVGTLKLYSYLEVEKANSGMFVKATHTAETQIAMLQSFNTIGSSCADKTLADITDCKLTLDIDSPFSLALNVASEGVLKNNNAAGVEETYAKVLIVSVSWNDRSGSPKNLSIPTSVSKHTNLLN
ncbi:MULTISPECIES: prepilin-type N-terminal cleavage/methylation domain-containing protein [Enterovibrio]|uniref:TypIV pilin n=1 Tax=Enterovibrio norvegicus FF-454 TaxID=1185651 RepID=A0A1E5BY78_9GAMM|nr:prepilin-type N-terminal cleavage/methylation domain-containing protein [Enterovibrio norvegicus]OEE58236.1 typIV pilin [Enterovibrio norvegicus FF-454]OEE89835.1 typIV pilin [Enterovibrio norvegicus FF-162]